MFDGIKNLFADSGEILLSPDEFFYLNSEKQGYGGIFTLLLYNFVLSLIIGLFINDLGIGLILFIVLTILTLISKLITAIWIHIFAKYLFKGNGGLLNTFNLICYTEVTNVFIIFAIAFLVLGKNILIPVITLVSIWEMVLTIIIVNSVYKINYGKAFFASFGIILLLSCIMGLLL